MRESENRQTQRTDRLVKLDSVSMIKLVIALFATVLVTSIVFLSNKKASKKMNELEEL